MDPISIAGIVESSLGLGLQLGNAAKSLNDVAGKYKNAKLTIKSLAQNLEILQLTWTQIGRWFETCTEDGSLYDENLVEQVKGFLEAGTLVMEALAKDLLAYDIENLNFAQRSKLIWNENKIQGHQVRIRDQTLSMSLFLQAVKLPTPKARAKLLRDSEDQFRRSDESAYSIDSIIPSLLSVSTNQHSLAVSSQCSLEYHPLSFENKLFMSRVYMRNSKNTMIRKIFKYRAKPKGETGESIQPDPKWEAIRDVLDEDSLLHSSQAVSFQDDMAIRPYNNHEDKGRSPQHFDNPNVTSQESAALLLRACEQENSVLVRDLIFGGVDIHAASTEVIYSGYKAIHVAALHGHINVVQKLLDYSANVEETDAIAWRRPLHFAAGSRQTSMVKFLIEQGAQVDAKARNAVQPIHEASWSGSIEILDALIEAGAAVDCSDWLGYQPLHWATLTPNQPDVIKYLSNKKADINAKTSEGLRAVTLVSRADAANLGMLLALGAVTSYDDGTSPALITAVNLDCKVAVKLLLEHGVDPNCRSSDGSTALHALARLRATSLGESLNDKEICQLLLDHGANVHIKDKNGYQVLHCLASYDSTFTADCGAIEELVKLVLDRGADPDATICQGSSPLYLAICHGNRLLSRLLIRSWSRVLVRTDTVLAKLEIKTPASKTPLHIIKVWPYMYGSKRPWRPVFPSPNIELPDLSFELPVDDDGYITDSAMKETLTKLKTFQALSLSNR